MGSEIRLADLTRLAAGREAEVFAIDDKRVLRVAFLPSQQADVDREALVLAAAHDAGAPVPAVHDRVTVDGRPGLIVDRLDGEDLLVRLGQRPWLVWGVASTLGRVHARVHRVTAPGELPALREQLRRQLLSELVPGDVREHALGLLEELPDGDQLCHCDFHPANLLRRDRGFAVIDWCHAARGDPAADVARTRLLLDTAALPDGTPAAMRALTHIGRRLIVSGYMRSYRNESQLSTATVARWRPVLVAARLAEDIEAERATLLALARHEDRTVQRRTRSR
jgi:aminoglycoside phosphotransferase (APT) family kinase protein